MIFKRRAGIFIPASQQYEEYYIRIKEHLERRVKHYQTSSYSYYVFYLESEKGLLIPRFFPIHKYCNAKINDICPDGDDIEISSNIKPRNKLQERAISHMSNNDSSIMQLEPGTGKTVITIKIIAERKKKTFILVHRDTLVDQWSDRIKTFTNLNNDEIVRLNSKNFVEALTHPIIITTDQTFTSLLKRNRTNFLKALSASNIGMFVADEVHTSVGAPTFAECSIHIPAKIVFGLSATPYRHDKNEDIIRYHLGEIYSDEDSEGTMEPKVIVFLFDFMIIKPRMKYIYWGGKFQRARYLNMMKKSKLLIKVIKGLINKFKDRNLVITSDRVKFLEMLYDWSPEENKSKFIGSAKNDALYYRETYATTHKIRDGIDIPEKDCLIMTSPVSNISQMTGRITRKAENKKQPIIIDLVDVGCFDMGSTLHSRIDYYNNKGWDVKYMLISSSGTPQIIDEEVARRLVTRE